MLLPRNITSVSLARLFSFSFILAPLSLSPCLVVWVCQSCSHVLHQVLEGKEEGGQERVIIADEVNEH